MIQKKEGFYGWKAISAVALSVFFVGGVGYTFSAFLPALHTQFGWPVGQISFAMSLMMGLMTLSAPGVGFIIGKYGVRKAVCCGNMLIALAFFALAFTSKQWQFHLAYAVVGIGAGLAGIVAAGTLASNWFIKKAPLAMSIIMGAMGLGGLVLAPLTAMLIDAAGWRHAYIALGGSTLILGVIAPSLFIRNKPEDLGQIPDGINAPSDLSAGLNEIAASNEAPVNFTVKEALGTFTFWILSIFGGIPVFMMVFLMAHQVNFLTRGIGLSNETAGLAAGFVSGASVLGNLGIGALSLRFNVKRLALLATALMALSMVLALFTKNAFCAFLYSTLFGLGLGATLVSMMSLTSTYFGRSHFSKILGISMLFTLLSTLGAPIGGYIYDITKSYNMAFLVGITAGAIAFVLLLFVRPPVHPSLKTRG